MTISVILKNIRIQLKISQEELARHIHVSHNTVNRWENNKSNPNNMAKALLIDFCKKRKIEQEIINAIENLKK